MPITSDPLEKRWGSPSIAQKWLKANPTPGYRVGFDPKGGHYRLLPVPDEAAQPSPVEERAEVAPNGDGVRGGVSEVEVALAEAVTPEPLVIEEIATLPAEDLLPLEKAQAEAEVPSGATLTPHVLLVSEALLCIEGLPSKQKAEEWAATMAKRLKLPIDIRHTDGRMVKRVEHLGVPGKKKAAAAPKKATAKRAKRGPGRPRGPAKKKAGRKAPAFLGRVLP